MAGSLTADWLLECLVPPAGMLLLSAIAADWLLIGTNRSRVSKVANPLRSVLYWLKIEGSNGTRNLHTTAGVLIVSRPLANCQLVRVLHQQPLCCAVLIHCITARCPTVMSELYAFVVPCKQKQLS